MWQITKEASLCSSSVCDYRNLAARAHNHIQDTVFSKKDKLDANQISKVHKHVKMTPARWTVPPE